MKNKIYEFKQNNSGGSFDSDEHVCHRVFIEAKNCHEANAKAERLGIYFDGCYKDLDCDCCGDRWYTVYEKDFIKLEDVSKSYKKDFESIEDYIYYVCNRWGGWTSPDARVFYSNGDVLEINKKD